MIPYISYNQLVDDIRANLWKVPRDIDLILSIPRSGNMIAGILSKFLNVNTMTIQEFLRIMWDDPSKLGEVCAHGSWTKLQDPINFRKILVVDDTICSGTQLAKWRDILSAPRFRDFSFIGLTVYQEANINTDIVLRDIRYMRNVSELKTVLYEWTIFNRWDILQYVGFDFDGVFCIDPPDDADTEAYEKYIANPIPLYVPLIRFAPAPATVITYRLDKYRDVSRQFLEKQGLDNCNLIMTNFASKQERDSTISPWSYKAQVYKQLDYLKLYVESDDFQAQYIAKFAEKPVFCVSTNKMYNN